MPFPIYFMKPLFKTLIRLFDVKNHFWLMSKDSQPKRKIGFEVKAPKAGYGREVNKKTENICILCCI